MILFSKKMWFGLGLSVVVSAGLLAVSGGRTKPPASSLGIDNVVEYRNEEIGVSFTLPTTVAPLTDPVLGRVLTPEEAVRVVQIPVHSFENLLQFSRPSHIPEGEGMPILQISESKNIELFERVPHENLTLLEYVVSNEIRSRTDMDLTTDVAHGEEQILLCEKRTPRSCQFFLLTKDRMHVVRGSLHYPRQGPRSSFTDPVLEAAFEMMRTTVRIEQDTKSQP